MEIIEQRQESVLVYNRDLEETAEGEEAVLLGRPASSWRRQLRMVAAEVLATACSYDQSVSNKTTIRQSGGIDALCDLAAEDGPFPMGYNTEDGGYWYTREFAMGRAQKSEGRQRPAGSAYNTHTIHAYNTRISYMQNALTRSHTLHRKP
jgi:hypothetical protein